MHNSVGGKHVKGDNPRLASGGLHLDVLVPCHGDLLAPGGLHVSRPNRHVLGGQGGGGNDMPEEHGGESLLVGKQAVQGVLGHLGEGSVGGSEHGEGSITGEGVHEASSLDSGKQSGELGSGDGQLCDVLGRGRGGQGEPLEASPSHRAAAVTVVAGGGGGNCEAGEDEQALHGGAGGGG